MMWRMLGGRSSDGGAPGRLARGSTRGGASEDAREGVVSFLEKRAPAFPLKVSTDLPDIFPNWEEPEFS